MQHSSAQASPKPQLSIDRGQTPGASDSQSQLSVGGSSTASSASQSQREKRSFRGSRTAKEEREASGVSDSMAAAALLDAAPKRNTSQRSSKTGKKARVCYY